MLTQLLQNESSMWRTIVQKLEEKEMIDEELPLICVNHGNTGGAKCPKDFLNFPEGMSTS